MSKEPFVIDEPEVTTSTVADPNENIVIDEDNGEDTLLEPGDRRMNDDGTVTIALWHPRKLTFKKNNALREEELKELTIRRPTGADVRKIAAVQDEMEGAVRAFQVLTGHPPAVFDVLDGEDITAITEVVQGMMGKSRRIGRNI